jgi:hypothetical protein
MTAHDSTSQTAEYRRFQIDLADEISPDEALSAEEVFRRGRVALLTVAGGWAALVTAAVLLPGLRAQAIVSDVAQGLLIAACLVLGARYRTHFAGRLLFSLSAFQMLLGVLDLPPESQAGLVFIGLLVFGPLFWSTGWLLDQGASTEQRNRRPKWGVGGLWAFALVFGALLLSMWYGSGRLEGEPFPLASLLACVLAAAWPWWPGPQIERGRPLLVPDADLLLKAATRRWLIQLAGRILAVLFAVFPLFLFLCNLGLGETVLAPSGREKAVATADAPGGKPDRYWYWLRAMKGLEGKAEGRFLLPADLGGAELYVVPQTDQAVMDARQKVIDKEKDTGAFQDLRRLLKPYRLSTVDDLRNVEAGKATVLQVGQGRSRPTLGHPEGELIHFVLDNALTPLTGERIGRMRKQLLFTQCLLAVCGLFSFILLWRRGGDSPAARWLAFCLAGTAVLAAFPYMDLYLPAMIQSLWVEALQSPLHGLLLGGLSLLQAVSLPIAIAVGVIFAAVWVHLCWPPPVRSRRRRLSILGRTAVASLALLVPAVAGLLVWLILNSMGVLSDSFTAVGTSMFAACAFAAVGGGVLMRRKSAGRSEVPELSPLAGLAFLCFQAAFWISVLAMAEEPLSTGSLWLGIACILGFALFSAWLILRKDVFHLAAGQDLGQLVFMGVLGVLFEKSEDLSGFLMADTLFSSSAGKSTLGLVIVLVLFTPVQRLLERYAAYLAVPGLRKIEKAVEGSLEWLVGLGDAAAVRQAAEGFFSELEVTGALLYRRAADGRLERLLGPDEAPEVLMPSTRLRSHLAGKGGAVIDLAGVHLNLRHFFLQHELARMERATGGRYLLPICLGSSLRGLAVLPDGPTSRRVCRDLTGAEVGKLGLVVTEAGRAGVAPGVTP